ncbi:putative 4-hydroxy-4-methyl-2-oxoglutarate aldolase 2 [Tanacetum coccineum]|uniref:4-hydroxy-4-methyl-2-oxoglutarate aldolase 2 n=1 Tax=Tanacetum coccineum TaxID=301880 RepID=A0ABQ5AU86_9ASTR
MPTESMSITPEENEAIEHTKSSASGSSTTSAIPANVPGLTEMDYIYPFLLESFSIIWVHIFEEKCNGRVLVVDGGRSLRCAILGGNPVVQAQNNGWDGIVVNGCVRDVDEINSCDIGFRALASHLVKANKKGIGDKHVPVAFAGRGYWMVSIFMQILMEF